MDNRVRVRLKSRRAKANRLYFTDAELKALLPRTGKQFLAWDADKPRRPKHLPPARGLAVLVSPTGTKSFRCVYYFPGSPKPHWLDLGRVGVTSLEEARQRCRDAQRVAHDGGDPRGSPDHADSFKSAVESYIQHKQIGTDNRVAALKTQQVILRSCADWLPRSVATIQPREIEKLLWVIRDGDEGKGLKPRPPLAKRLHAHLNSFFKWCARPSGFLKTSPMLGIDTPVMKVEPRDRPWFKNTAADDAIKSLWQAADQIGGVESRYVKTMLLLAKRKTALANMRWEEIDDTWFWNAPASGTNKRLHGVPLSRLAQRVLGPRQQGKVFGELTERRLGQLQTKLRTLSGIKDFIWHGVRHLCETKTAALRDAQGRPLIPLHIRDLLYDHSTQRGSGKGYDHHDYLPEMRTAVEAWAAHVEGLVQPEGAALLR
jgi:hypothetical protein